MPTATRPADPGPGVEPRAQRTERAVVQGQGAPGEADSSTKELAALVEHAYSMTWSARSSTDGGIVSLSAFAVFALITSSNLRSEERRVGKEWKARSGP